MKYAALLIMLLVLGVGLAKAERPRPWGQDADATPTPVEQSPTPMATPIPWYDPYLSEGKDDTDGDGVADDYDCDPNDPLVGKGYVYYYDFDLDGLGYDGPHYSVYRTCDPMNLTDEFNDYYLARYGCHIVDNAKDVDDSDYDNDHVPTTHDCDDKNALVMGHTAYHKDGDADGMGDPKQPMMACSKPKGYVINACDLDDTKASSNPTSDFQTCWKQ